MAHEKIVTMFNNITHAEGAKRSLIKAGFSENDIDIISGERLQSEGHEARHPGLWQRLFGDTVDEEQAGVYEDAMNSGGVVLSLRAEEEQLPRALSIIDAHDSGDISQYGASRLQSGQAGYADDAGLRDSQGDYAATGVKENQDEYTAAGLKGSQDEYTSAGLEGRQNEYSSAGEVNDPLLDIKETTNTAPVRTSLTGDETEEEVLRLAEERLEVGKRLVSEGSTRVRRYTVTEPITQEVSLHEQHADIFRRPVTQQAAPGEVDWSEKTVEVAETHEQPVINKTTHVTEEVVVRKDESDRVETVNDSVRRQEVDIDHASSERVGEADTLATDATIPGATPASATGADATTSDMPDYLKQDKKESLTDKVSDEASSLKNKAEDKFKP